MIRRLVVALREKEIDIESEIEREKKGVWVEGKGEKVRENEF